MVPSWSLRAAEAGDRELWLRITEETLREHIERVWGWDDEEQAAYLDEHFRPGEGWSIVQVDGEDAGRLVVAESVDELYLAEIGLLPAWQGRGIGTAIIRSLTRDAAAAGKPLILRVLHVNTRARALYERLGFIPVRDIETHAYLRWAA